MKGIDLVSFRIIPRLDIKGPNLVKGIHFEGLRVLGSPEAFADYYYNQGADELMYVDVVASLYDRNSLHDVISRTASKTFVPITVSGGIRTIEDINKVLRSGADKVSVNTAAVNNPEFIREAARKFGSSTILVTIEAQRNGDGSYSVLTNNGREETELFVKDWAKQVEEYGAGEIVISSVDNEGTGDGFDVELTSLVNKMVSIPVIAHGGAGSVSDVLKVAEEGMVDAVSIASILHYKAIADLPRNENSLEGNYAFKSSGKSFNQVSTTSIPEIRALLEKHGIECRSLT